MDFVSFDSEEDGEGSPAGLVETSETFVTQDSFFNRIVLYNRVWNGGDQYAFLRVTGSSVCVHVVSGIRYSAE